MSNQQSAIRIAKENNFDTAKPYGSWGGFSVFVAEDNADGDNIPIIGYPAFILIDKAGNARLATPNETFGIMGV